MSDPQFEALIKPTVKAHHPPMKLETRRQIQTTSVHSFPAPDSPPLPSPPNMFFTVEVNDFNTWYSGFKEHATSNTVKGLVLPNSRSEFVNEEKTVVMKHVSNANKVAGLMVEVKMDKLGEMLGSENFSKLAGVLGEIESKRIISILTDVPAPAQELWNKA